MARNLNHGDRGEDVETLQRKLHDLSYAEVGDPDGKFGDDTDAAVRRYQTDHGLKVDGIVGPYTGTSLGLEGYHLPAGTPPMSTLPTAEPAAASHLVGVAMVDSKTYRMTFSGPMSVDAAWKYVFPGGAVDGVVLSGTGDEYIWLVGMSWDAARAMDPAVYAWIAQAGVITAEEYEPPAGGGGTGGGGGAGAPAVKLDESTAREIEKQIMHWIEGGGEIAHVAEVTAYLTAAGGHVAGSATVVAAAEHALHIIHPVGGILVVVWVGYLVIDAFKGERRREVTQGFCYGLMWEAMGESDQLPKFAPGITYSAEEHEEAFREGVTKGRDKAREAKVKNAILVSVGVIAVQTGFGEMYAAQQVLSEIWRSNRERAPGEDEDDLLMWPKPWDRTVLGH